MGKTKIRCNTCGKWFQSANAKEITCPDCLQKARKEKMAAKMTPPPTAKTGTGVKSVETPPRSVPPQPKPATSGTSHWLDTQSDVKIGEPDQPTKPKIPSSPVPRDNRGGQERSGYPATGAPGPGGYKDRDERGPGGNRGPGGYRETDYRSPGAYRESNYRGSAPYRVGGGMGIPDTVEQRPRQPMTGPGAPRPGAPGEPRQGGKPGWQGKLKQKTPKPKPETPPKPKREKIPPPAPFQPTGEQIAQVEARYIELAVPTEFDGIRTQISKELEIPKTAVKKIIKELREKQEIPSWWDLQTYKGDEEEKAKIKAAYEPHLPLPAVGIHKQIAEEFSLKPGDVYQAIKAIRLEMNLPQFNDPALHGLELKPRKKAQKTEEENQEPAAQESTEVTAEEQKPDVKDGVESTEDEQKPDVKESVESTEEAQQLEVKDSAESHAEPQQPASAITSIETDVTFHIEGDTLEVTDQPSQKEDEKAETVANASSETKVEGEA